MTSRSVLISGAGVAGPTLAYWLARQGFQPTVVERSQDLRSSGNPVDVRGQALPIAERMDLIPRLRAVATTVTQMRVIDSNGQVKARIPTPSARSAAGNREVELPRGDLAAVLYEAAKNDAEFCFDETIVALTQDGDGVDVVLDQAGERRFDLVIGADGVHSLTRRLVFGPERDFVRHMGVYVASIPLGEAVDHPEEILMYNTPGRLVAVHPSRGDKAMYGFIFRGGEVPGFDYRDTEQHKQIVVDAYRDAGWRVPEFLDRLRKSGDFYFDSVSRVRLPRWSNGRVALIGDAASCLSLFGDGSTLAMVGAYTLASALGATPDDHEAAFARYEATHRKLVTPKQRGVGLAAGLIVPRTRLGIALRNVAASAFIR
jgi:2-polyprenyl-6-methoxyphenol hydroxylase-like FAD-dependent oxidoreductase